MVGGGVRESGRRPMPRNGVRKPPGAMTTLVISYCEWPASSGRLDAVTLFVQKSDYFINTVG